MRINKTNKIITTVVVFLSSISIFAIISSSNFVEQRRALSDVKFEYDKETTELLSKSELITSKAEAYASTGDEVHLAAFNNEIHGKKSIDVLIKNLEKLGLTLDEVAIATKIKNETEVLITLEHTIFEDVKNKNIHNAASQIYGYAYTQAKKSRVSKIGDLDTTIKNRIDLQQDALTLKADIASKIAYTVLIINTLGVLISLLWFYRLRIINPLVDLTGKTKSILSGDKGISYGYEDDDTEIGELATSLESYRITSDEFAKRRYKEKRHSEIVIALQRTSTYSDFGEALFQELTAMHAIIAGALYFKHEDGKFFECVYGYAIDQKSLPLRNFILGEGLIGEAARSGERKFLREVPVESMHVPMGFGNLIPDTIMVLPIKSDTQVLAILELAMISVPSEEFDSILDDLSDLIAPRLEILIRNIKTEELLELARVQADELAVKALQLEARKSELEQQKAILAKSESQTRLILASASEGVIGLDFNGLVTFCNQAVTQLLGFEADELIGKDLHDVIHHSHPDGSDYPGSECPMRGAFTVGQRCEISDEVLWKKDGTALEAEYIAVPLLENEKTIGAVITFKDITQKKAAAEVMRLGKEAAELAAKTKADFLANMSHEIRTPMNAIIGMSYLALKTDLGVKQRDYVEKIHNAGTSLLGIINDILDFSKIEAGKLSMESVDFEIDEVLRSVGAITAHKAQEKGLELLMHKAADVPQYLSGDSLRIRQILTNLIGNAVKFTEKGEVELDVKILEAVGEKVKLQFSIRDTGIGMSKEQSEKLFQAFTQVDTSITRKYGGTGLGLTISKKLVEMMGGDIWVESALGVGSTFICTAWFNIAKEIRKKQVIPEAISGLRILIVDDNSVARTVLEEMLTELPVEVIQASDGAECVRMVKEADADKPFGLVLIDWKMPIMNGTEAVKILLQEAGLIHPPHIIMITAFSKEDLQEETNNFGIDGYLSKPISASTLMDSIINIYAEDGVGESLKIEDRSYGLENFRVLLAEDNEINQQIAVELLESQGVIVQVVNNGFEAFQSIKTNPEAYDLILMDLQMPVMDGFNATKQIKDSGCQIPIVAMTAHALAEEKAKCIAAGMVGHISKPIDPDNFYRTIALFVNKEVKVSVLKANEPLDMTMGLKRTAGNRVLYEKILGQFAQSQKDVPEQILELAKKGKWDEAHVMAHTLKGVSGNIGADHLFESVTLLDEACKNQDIANIENYSSICKDRMAEVLAYIDSMVFTIQENLSAIKPNINRKEIIEKLFSMLTNNDGMSVDFLSENFDTFRTALGEADADKFHTLVNIFEFDKALDILKGYTNG